MKAPIYFASVLLESNRWIENGSPSFCVSEWAARLATVGFDGVELWENHFILADAAERTALRTAPLAVAIFNSYASMTADGALARQQAAAAVSELGARGVKFNVGRDPVTLAAELRAAREWGTAMPGTALLCECHPGTALENPAAAAAALADYPEIGVIVHPCICADLPGWIRHCGPKIRHLHVQMLDAQRRRWLLRDQAPLVRERLTMLRDTGFDGTLTIEFTAGVAVAPENREALFASACADLAFLRDEGF